MKIITCLLSCLLCFVATASFATATIGSSTFCKDYVDDSRALCYQMKPGNILCEVHTRTDMDRLYTQLLLLGRGDLTQACTVATISVNQPQEKLNCVAKWNSYRANC